MTPVWVVAHRIADTLHYLCGPCPGYTSGTLPFASSADINDAIQFVREQDAAEMADYLGPDYAAALWSKE